MSLLTSSPVPSQSDPAFVASEGWPVPISPNYKWIALFISTLGMLMATIDGSIVAHRPARHLPGHRDRPAPARQQLLPALDDPGLPRGDQRPGHHPGPHGRHLRPGPHLQPGLRPLHLLLPAAHHHLDDRARGGRVAHRAAHPPGRGRRHADGQLGRHPDRRLPRRSAGHGHGGQPGGGLERHVHRAGARWHPGPASTGASSSWCRCPSVCSPPCWGYLKLRELSPRRPAHIDWPGNITFALGLICVMVGITYGIEPYRVTTMGWTNPFVLDLPGPRRACCSSPSASSRPRWRSRCSACSSSRSAPSPPGSSPASWPRSAGAASCSC